MLETGLAFNPYISKNNDRFLFASEQNILHVWAEPELDYLSISSYVQGFGGPHNSHSFYKDISILPPGCVMRITNGQCGSPEQYFSLGSFWNPDYHDQLNQYSDNQVIDKMDELLYTSVERHMLSDTPVGALCSGGVDSSIIMAMASKISSNLAIFHADVVGPNSEKDAAIELSNHLGLDLNVVSVSDNDFIDNLAKVTYHYGQPFVYHPNSVPFMKVTELVKHNNVKAILTGEAADECFLGYSYLPTEDFIGSFHNTLRKLQKFIARTPLIYKVLFQNNHLNNELLMNIHNRFETELTDKQIQDELKAITKGSISSSDFKTLRLLGYHLRTLLHRNDALGMASSIEARFPFLDHDLVQFAVNLPYKYKIRKSFAAYREKKHPFMTSKWVVRKVADRYLPRSLSRRPKRGFPTDAFERMKIDPAIFKDSFVSDMFNLSMDEVEYLGNVATDELKLRLMLLDLWGRLNFHNEDVDKVSWRAKNYIEIN